MRLYELFIGWRYLKSKKNQGGVSSNTLLSIVIVFLGVFILIVVLSVMNGFQAAIKDKILDVDAHITVSNIYGISSRQGIKAYRPLMEKIKGVDGVVSVEPFIQGQGLFRFGTTIAPVLIRGMGSRKKMSPNVQKFVVEGQRDFSKGYGVFIGSEMGVNYNILLGDYIELIVPKGRLTASTGVTPGLQSFRVIGFFKTAYYEFDTKLVIMSLPSAQRLFEVGDIVWGIGAKIKDVYRMDETAREIQGTIGYQYMTRTAEERNRNLFYALRLEKLIMMIILSLVIVSAGFSIMGTLVMVVMEKRKAVGVLKSMGARPNSIMVIFILEGFFIGIIGSLTGVVLGVAASLNLNAIITWIETSLNTLITGTYMLINTYTFFDMGTFSRINLVPSQVYYIEGIPAQVKPELVVFIAIMAIFISAVAAIVPAWNASRLRPVETIRYE